MRKLLLFIPLLFITTLCYAGYKTDSVTITTLPSKAALATNADGKIIEGSGGSGDITSVGDVASGAAFDGTQGTTLTFNNAGGDATLLYDGTTYEIDKSLELIGNYFIRWQNIADDTSYFYIMATAAIGGGATISSVNVPLNLKYGATGSDVQLSMDISGNLIWNYDANDCDFTLNKNTAGQAYIYDAGLDTHLFDGASVSIGNGATSSGILRINEDTSDGSNYASFQVPSLAGNTAYTLPPDDGDAGEQLQTNGSGVLTWEAAGGAGGGGESLAATLAIGADANDVDTTSWGKMEGFDAGLYLDWDADGVIDLTSDGTLELHSADWDISTTGAISNCSLAAADNVIEADTVLTITGLAPDTATTQAAQPNITSLGALTGLTMAGIIADNDDMVFECDANNDGTNSYSFTDGASTEIANLSEAGNLQIDGTFTIATSAIFSGGDTTSLNLIDAIDATTETTLESALDIDGEVSSTGMGTTVLDETGIALTSITIGSLLGVDSIDATGAADMDYGSADITDHTFVTDGGTVILDGTVNSSTLTASEIVITDASKNLVSAAVATYPSLTELSYVKGLSSAIQTQINGKQATVTEGSLADSVIVSADIKDGTIAEADTSFIVTAGADPDVDATKELGVDTDDFWLRGYDGAVQYIYGQKAKLISFTATNPDLLTETAFVPIWTNKTGATFNVVAVYSYSDVDDAVYTLKYSTNATYDYTNLTTIEAITISTDGTGVFYNELTAAIDDTTVEDGKTIGFDNGATDCDFIHGVIVGYLGGDVN